MNAQQINEALAGVPAEALDKDLTWELGYPCISIFNRGGEWLQAAIHPDHAAMIQEASMRNWLEDRFSNGRVKVKPWLDEYYVEVRGNSGEMVFQQSAPTRLEALAAACRAMGGA